MSIYEISISSLSGSPGLLSDRNGHPTLIVNVASQCGLTPQYAGLERLHERYAAGGFSVVGVPCNQFGGQEPGGPEEIAEFCSTSYGVTFPLTEKVEVNGADRHPLYQRLTAAPDPAGEAGDVLWNFEKFLVDSDGSVVARFRPGTEPESTEVVAAVEALLGS
jgi:glutathione peroxidase